MPVLKLASRHLFSRVCLLKDKHKLKAVMPLLLLVTKSVQATFKNVFIRVSAHLAITVPAL